MEKACGNVTPTREQLLYARKITATSMKIDAISFYVKQLFMVK